MENELPHKAHRFQVNLGGVIELLSEHLYSSPNVFVRELLQNGVDATNARSLADEDFSSGPITFSLFDAKEESPPVLIVEDEGIGLTEPELHRFLSTIGSSSKTEEIADIRADFIGQFGIGLLSCFLVANEITVITRSAQESAGGFQWIGQANGCYSITPVETKKRIGTQVFLKAKAGAEEFYSADTLIRLLTEYGSLLPIPIKFCYRNRETIINANRLPWQVKWPNANLQEKAFLDFGRELFETEFLGHIPLHSRAGEVTGAAYIMPHSVSLNNRRSHRVYLKGMLVSPEADNVLPDWAFFVKAVICADALRPTASREGFYEDENLSNMRDELGIVIRENLVKLAQENPDKVEILIRIHYMAIKALASEDETFFKVFIDWLPFETSLGRQSFKQLRKSKVIRFVRTDDAYRQIAQVATAQRVCIINAGYTFDNALMGMVAAYYPELTIEEVDPYDFMDDFVVLGDSEREQMLPILEIANERLRPYNCYCDARQYEPVEVPATYAINEAAEFLRMADKTKEISNELFSSVLDNLTTEQELASSCVLYLNFNNPIVGKLAGVANNDLIGEVIETLYVQALLIGNHPLARGELVLLNNSMIRLMDRALDNNS